MKPTAEAFNDVIGRKVFAESIDQYGLPKDGWSIPCVIIKDDHANRQTKITIGSFFARDGQAVAHESRDYVIDDSVVAKGPTAFAAEEQRLLREFADSLPSK